MITFLVSDLNQKPLIKLLRRSRKDLPPIQFWTYEKAFYRKWVPGGTLIFTDFDLLTDFELDTAGTVARAAQAAGMLVLNDPARVLERATMHQRIAARGLPAVEVSRLELGGRPSRYPAFIRLQGGCVPPDTGLLHSEAEFESALSQLNTAGRPTRGRIAMTFEASPDKDGFFRKYGAIRIGHTIVPQHIVRNRHWYVKRADQDMNASFEQEQIDFIQSNPHAAKLMTLFDIAGHEFGRMDYTVVDGQIVVFEINSNPSFPNLTRAKRSVRHASLLAQLQRAFAAVDTGDARDRVPFEIDAAIGHNLTRSRWFSPLRVRWKRRLSRPVEPAREALEWPNRNDKP